MSILNQINTTADSIEALDAGLESNLNLIASLELRVMTLQTLVHNNTITILELQSNHNVTKIVNPCGDAPGVFDEVLLRTSSGKLIASFSSNGSALNTRFSELVPGNYNTTDGTGCSFIVTSGSLG
jgi:hypothetical protein